MDITLQEYLEKRVVQTIVQHAAGTVEMHYDCEESDLQMHHNDYKRHSIEETIEGFVQMGVDFLIDTDMNESGVVSFNRDKILEMAKRLVKEPTTEAYLAQCALLLRGYHIGTTSFGMLAMHIGKLVTEA